MTTTKNQYFFIEFFSFFYGLHRENEIHCTFMILFFFLIEFQYEYIFCISGYLYLLLSGAPDPNSTKYPINSSTQRSKNVPINKFDYSGDGIVNRKTKPEAAK